MNSLPSELLETYIRRLEKAKETTDNSRTVTDIAQDLLTLAAGDDPVWGAIKWRHATEHDPAEVQEFGWHINAVMNRPATYREVQKTINLFRNDPYKTLSCFYRIVPFAEQESRANQKRAELARKKAA